MKKVYKNLLLLGLLVCFTFPIKAYSFMVNGLCYNKNSDGVSVTVTYHDNPQYISKPAYPNLSGPINIPSSVTYSGVSYSVTAIGDYAFYDSDGITSISIPNSVTSIGNYTFRGSDGITAVTIPGSVTSIGIRAFEDNGLESIVVDPENTIFDSRNNCNAIIKIASNSLIAGCKNTIIPNSVTSIGDYAFSGCTGLTSIEIPNSVTTIGNVAFCYCDGLSSISIPKSVSNMGDRVFFYCRNLSLVEWDAVRCKYTYSYGNTTDLFIGCSSLQTVIFGENVSEIPAYLFNNRAQITSVTFGNSVKTIEHYAFKDCTGLSSLAIPNSVTIIGRNAFNGCSGLTDLTIGSSVTSIGDGAFLGNTNIKNLTIDNNKYASISTFSDSKESLESLVLGNSVTSLEASAFSGCKALKSVTIPNSITSIGTSAFSGCNNIDTLNIDNNKYASISAFSASKYNLKTLALGNSVTAINESAFSGCTSLNSLILPESISSIGSKAFYDCSSLKSVRIPKAVISLGSDAFSGCSSLDDIYYLGADTPFAAATTRTYVVDKRKFKTPQSTIKTPYNIIQYVDFNNTTFAYSNQIPNVTYTNNLPDWSCNLLSPPNLQDWYLSFGSHNVFYNFSFTKNGEAFDVEIPFYYDITKRTLTAKANNASRNYGDNNPQFTISYEGFVDGEGLSSITTPPTASTTATKSSDVGSYPITLTGGSADNYTFTYQSGTLSVTKAPLEAKINDAQRIYGQANPAFSMTYTGLKNGESTPKWNSSPKYQTPATQASPVGAYPIYLESGEPKNYYLTSITKGTLTVSARNLLIKANDASRPYGDDNPQFEFTCSGFVNGDDEQELSTLPTFQTDATKQSGVGNYDIIPLGAGARNYTISYQNGTLTVTKRPLTAKPTPISRYYGDPNPDLTIDYTSFVNGDDESSLASIPVASTTATTTSNVGSYAIKLTGGSATNYDITCENGTLTVVKAPVSITINDKERIYGDSNPSFTYTLQGLKNGETSPAWIVKPTLSTLATKTSPVGVYDINMNEPEAKNYEISTVTNGKLTVKKATLTARANNASRLYFEDNPTFTCTYSGFKNGENSSVISKVPQIYTDAKKTTKAGQYPIYINWAEAQNYDFTYVDGTLNINKRTIVATTPNYSRLYQEPNPQFEVSYSGFVNDETINVFHMVPWVKCDAGYNANVGTYPIIIYNGEADNYNFDYRGGYLTVQKKEQTISWEQDLSNVELYCNLELAAHASSNLPITYTLDNNNIANVYTAGERVYVECFAEGTVLIRAQQMGNNNWYASPRITRELTISRFGGVDGVYADVNRCYDIKGHDIIIHLPEVEIYDTKGQLIYAGGPTHLSLNTGIYIIRHNGKVYKELIR